MWFSTLNLTLPDSKRSGCIKLKISKNFNFKPAEDNVLHRIRKNLMLLEYFNNNYIDTKIEQLKT